ncbi:efflux transporter outer membrane subunit [Negadavirga shengliensis]|uniref:Efflux transporter outer membrane subunit n=1 Tax=Negadavirga shengliensis TaxID=1389218 RepID=A0ABV9T3U9_9BACT
MNHLKRFLPLALIVLTIASCKVGETYQGPEYPLPDKFYGSDKLQDSLFVGGDRIATINWREFFNDTILIALIDTALENNFDVQKIAKEVEIGMEMVKQSKANLYPRLGADPFRYIREYYGGNFNNHGSNRSRRNHGPDNIPTSFYTENLVHAISLQTSWELDIWGKFRWQKEAQLAEFMETQEFQKALQTALISDIASTYFSMLMLKSQMTVAERNYELSQNTLRIVRLQYEAGETTALAIQQTESQMLRAKALIPQLEKAYISQENRLNNLLGRAPQAIESIHFLEQIDFSQQYSAGVPIELVQNRPDVAAAEYNLIASNARVGITQAMKYPALTIGASTGFNSMRLDNLIDPVSSSFAILNGALFQPIFQNRRLKTNHRIAIKEKEIAELDFKETITTAVTEVSNALVNIEKLQEEYEIVEERLGITTQGLGNAGLLFQSGFANYLEVINAQEDFLQTNLDRVQLQMLLALAKVELYRSLGGGWQD